MDIWFDMDGTIADLYKVENWLAKILNSNAEPYRVAEPMANMEKLANCLNGLIDCGCNVNIVSWGCKNATREFLAEIAEAKKEWLAKYLPTVRFNKVDILPYGEPKQIGRAGVLFDDEKENRDNWNGNAYAENKIFEILEKMG